MSLLTKHVGEDRLNRYLIDLQQALTNGKQDDINRAESNITFFIKRMFESSKEVLWRKASSALIIFDKNTKEPFLDFCIKKFIEIRSKEGIPLKKEPVLIQTIRFDIAKGCLFSGVYQIPFLGITLEKQSEKPSTRSNEFIEVTCTVKFF